jgi:pyridoxine 4-dehydrogenase
MASETMQAQRFTLPHTSITVNRMGYGAMRLAGQNAWGPSKDEEGAIAVLREAVARGVDHIDTADMYGPHVVNQIIRKALHPYPDGLTIVTKVGGRRIAPRSVVPGYSREQLTEEVHDNLRNLGVDALEVVNLRVGHPLMPLDASIEEPLTILTELKAQGLIRHLGVSNVTATQVAEAQRITEIVCVQNLYNVTNRKDDSLVDSLAAQHIAYVPYFPLGGFSPLQSSVLDQAAATLGATPMQIALAWLLQRSPNMLLIPGTSSIGHLHENLDAAKLKLPAETVSRLDALSAS